MLPQIWTGCSSPVLSCRTEMPTPAPTPRKAPCAVATAQQELPPVATAGLLRNDPPVSTNAAQMLALDDAQEPAQALATASNCSRLSEYRPRIGTTPVRGPSHVDAALHGGCRIKPFKKTRSTLEEVHVRAAVRGDLATDHPLAMGAMAVFATQR